MDKALKSFSSPNFVKPVSPSGVWRYGVSIGVSAILISYIILSLIIVAIVFLWHPNYLGQKLSMWAKILLTISLFLPVVETPIAIVIIVLGAKEYNRRKKYGLLQ